MILLIVLNVSVRLDIQLSSQAAAPLAGAPLEVVDALREHTLPTDLIVTDDQGLADQAGRDTPPNLVDTSATRIASGYLTASTIEMDIVDYHVRAVLFATGRLDRLPGFRRWVEAHFPKEIYFGKGYALYLGS